MKKNVLLTVALCLASAPWRTYAAEVDLYTDAEVRTARENLEIYPEAASILEKMRESLRPWMECSLDKLWSMVPPPEVPRAFNTSYDGCPCHGRELYKGGFYSWLIDPWDKPWKVTCPIGGAEYPSNNFAAFLDTGMQDRSLLTGEYADDGWGVLLPGETKKRWFVAYYCHWFWMSHLLPAVLDLSRVYRLTGEEDYALRCAVLLDRIADFYPEMNYNTQSRYAQEFSPSYSGKILNHIWETTTVTQLAESYDAIREILPSLSYKITGKPNPIAQPNRRETIARDGEDIDRNIRENLLKDGLKCVLEDRTVRGNFGMHQRAALYVALALQEPETVKQTVDYVLDGTEKLPEDGLRYAFDNLFFREGVGFESAPGYCFTWTKNVLTLTHLLERLGTDLYADRHLPKISGAPARMIVGEKFTPAIGDFGNAVGGIVRLPPPEAARIWAIYHRPSEARDLLTQTAYGESWFSAYDSLFRAPPDCDDLEEVVEQSQDKRRSDVLHDYGLALLRSGQEPCDVAASVYFGQAAGHGQNDRLNLEVFAWGKKVVPDFGYPQFMSEDKQTFAWDRHTASHVVVEVDERRQENKNRGKLRMFGVTDDDVLSYVEVSSDECYGDRVDIYRRGVALINAEDSAYLLDVFWVRGGGTHDYSIHVFDAPLVETSGIELIEQATGTLAGEDIPYGYLYDDQELEQPDKKRSFSSYRGSGYSYLTDVRRGSPGRAFRLNWCGDEVGLQMSFLGDGMEDVALSRGRPPCREANPLAVDFVRLREPSDGDTMSVFVTLIHPYKEDPSLRGGRIFDRDRDGNLQLTVLRNDGHDRVTIHPGRVCRLERYSEGTHQRSWQVAAADGWPEPWRVERIDAERNRVLVRTGPVDGADEPHPDETILFLNADRIASYTVQAAESVPQGWWVDLGDDRPVIGRIRVAEVDKEEGIVRSVWSLPMADGGRYDGARLVSADRRVVLPIVDGHGRELRVGKSSGLSRIYMGEDLWIEDFGVGDEAVVCQTR